MSDGREEREAAEKRREQEKRENREDRIERYRSDEGEPDGRFLTADVLLAGFLIDWVSLKNASPRGAKAPVIG